MKRESLKQMELSEEQIEKIMSMNGADIENAKQSVGDVDAIKQENDTLRSQIADRDKDIKSLQKQTKDNDELTNQLQSLQDKYQQDTDQLNQQLQETKFNSALNTALTSANVRNPKAVSALIDKDKLELTDENSIKGLDDQLSALKESDAYLFDEGSHGNYNPGGGDGSQDNNEVDQMINAFTGGKSNTN
ncbi:phage scaffolding protein [Lentilactobacillus senioris]|uniref:phage scaffolding protein n=1 Tax=Lentilactobacillus senioris TaxID=931534 RepID=UPI00227F6C7E|nr:phage scaffolding protein [Lentilactobacillus senioris]MCY9807465.1 phage scaffolding protein [Lentilactobacillus senioris]